MGTFGLDMWSDSLHLRITSFHLKKLCSSSTVLLELVMKLPSGEEFNFYSHQARYKYSLLNSNKNNFKVYQQTTTEFLKGSRDRLTSHAGEKQHYQSLHAMGPE